MFSKNVFKILSLFIFMSLSYIYSIDIFQNVNRNSILVIKKFYMPKMVYFSIPRLSTKKILKNLKNKKIKNLLKIITPICFFSSILWKDIWNGGTTWEFKGHYFLQGVWG